MIIFYLNSKVEIARENNIFNFLINDKKKTKDEINKNYDHINIEKMDKNLDVKMDNYFHLNWTEKNMINMDFKDEKLLGYLCGLCGERIILFKIFKADKYCKFLINRNKKSSFN